MTHTFLLQSGRWIIRGNWFDKKQNQFGVTGGTIITWEQANWFTMKTKLVFAEEKLPEINYEQKGYLPNNIQKYKYISVKHSQFNKIEGEGWLCNDSILQRYWVLEDKLSQTGFEHLFCLDENTYHFSSSIMRGKNIHSTMEAIMQLSG